MQTFIKRLAANELGHTGGHQRGGVLIPKRAISYFPAPGPGPNPETSVTIKFRGSHYPVTLRVIYYDQGTRNEYRLTPVPHEVLRNAQAGDYFILQEQADGTFIGGVARDGEPLHATIRSDIGYATHRITPKNYL